MNLFSNWNGEIVENGKICISPDNRSFKYGDGCFETIKVVAGNIVLSDLHFQRLFSSLRALKFYIPASFTKEYLTAQISDLVKINQHERLARVRLVAYRGDGGLYDLKNNALQFIIQSTSGNPESNHFNNIGLHIDIFADAKKTADLFSSIKSNNYLGYAMGAIWAKEHSLDDAVLTNAWDRIADATIANIFIISAGIIKTPALTEGCIDGVMRRYLLDRLTHEGQTFAETGITISECLSASEIFLTNANYGIRWVQKLRGKTYNCSISSLLHNKFIAPLYTPATF